MKEIEKLLLKYQDEKNAKFQAKLAPTIDGELFLGVRMPDCRTVAKEIKGTKLEEQFLNELPHKYYDENMLHSVILNGINNFDRAICETERFLPYVDNWATCDTMHSKGLGKNKTELLKHIKVWIKSEHTYTVRFAIDCLMNYFLDNDSFKLDYLDMVFQVKTEQYYINMMIAWYLATALAKQYDVTIKFIEKKTLSSWVQNKTIQKAKESYRITSDQKQYLDTLKI